MPASMDENKIDVKVLPELKHRLVLRGSYNKVRVCHI